MSATSIIVAAVMGVLLAMLLRGRDGGRNRGGGKPPAADLSAPSEENIRRILTAGRKIEAIKLYRQLYGVDLKEAKEAVDRMVADLPPSHRA